MFDIGFTELLLCLIVALVVIGPEQLPGTVRTIGLWIGRLKRSLRETRSEIERQIGADDIRRQLHNEEIMRTLEQTRINMENSILAGEEELDAHSEERRKKRNYGPPEELPDHAHLNEPRLATPAPSTEASSTEATPAAQPDPVNPEASPPKP